MPINPIQEQRKLSKKYVIGCYSENSAFQETLEQALNTTGINLDFTDLTGLDDDTLGLYLSTLDEAIFDTRVPENASKILSNLKLFIRVVGLNDIEKLPEKIAERSKLTLELKKEKNFEREKDLKFIMQIVSILENKDPYTKDHSARVAKYSLAIGEEFFGNQYDELHSEAKEQNPEQYEKLKHDYIVQKMNLTMLASWAHDIGKNSIAQNLLNKNSKLTENEYDIMKLHADFGAEMVRKILGDEELAEILENHHERIDGNGYHNLTEFSDIAKIVAIADSFDAMTTTRSYTTKLEENENKSKLKTVEEAINELQVSSHLHLDIETNRMSQQLDTSLTDIFVKILKRDLSLIKDGKTDETTALSELDKNGFLKAGFWDDKTQEYSQDKSVLGSLPNFLK
ncbi:MAG: HD domain-containing protein [Clostridia bacterium]|nr:HD domain-containing protein [Clostridia bacterium]